MLHHNIVVHLTRVHPSLLQCVAQLPFVALTPQSLLTKAEQPSHTWVMPEHSQVGCLEKNSITMLLTLHQW